MAKIATTQTKENTRQVSSNGSNDQQEIAKLSYQFFLERGSQHGHDREDWLRAEAIVKKKRQ